jgi:hypothetical protein
MRKAKQVQAVACAVAAALGVSRSASANLLIYEPFDYSTANTSLQTSGALAIVPSNATVDTGNGPGVGLYDTSGFTNQHWNAAGTLTASAAPHQILTPGLTGPTGLPAAIGNAASLSNADFGQMARMNLPGVTNTTSDWVANKAYYYSLLLNVPDISGLTVSHTNVQANNDLIIGINNSFGVTAAKPNTWSGELVIRLGSTAGTYNLGIRSSTNSGAVYFTGDLSPGDTHFVVARMTDGATQGTQTNDLWIDPASFGGDAPTPDGTTAGTLSATNDFPRSIIIGAFASGATPTDTRIDELRVGETWADVTTGTSVPEPTAIGVLSLGGLALMRRRRRC